MARFMQWRKRDRWKTATAIVGLQLLLVLMVWVPVSASGAYKVSSGQAVSVTVLMEPTIDATMITLEKERLAQEIRQLQEQK